MILKIQYPYTKRFDKAYLVNSQGRNTVCLYNTETKVRLSTSYARYLISCKEGRILLKDESVDHIDNDKSNDTIENLQILSLKENKEKQNAFKGRNMVEYQCPICSVIFSRRRGLSHFFKKDSQSTTCSRSCGGKASHMQLNKKTIFIREWVDHSIRQV